MKKRVAGVREAKEHLSALLRDAQRGKVWTITDRGVPVARIVPAESDELTSEERVRRLEVAGILKPPANRAVRFPPPLPLERSLAQQYLQDDRDESL